MGGLQFLRIPDVLYYFSLNSEWVVGAGMALSEKIIGYSFILLPLATEVKEREQKTNSKDKEDFAKLFTTGQSRAVNLKKNGY